MSYLQTAEECGAAVAAGLMDRAAAVGAVYAAARGGLTLLGAEEALSEWQTLRARFADLRMNAELGIATCEAQIRREWQ
jgi:hypothetical protein